MKFEVGKTYIARDGSKWRILATDLDKEFPIAAVSLLDNDSIIRLTAQGRIGPLKETEDDLIREAREPREWTLLVDGDFRMKWLSGSPFTVGETVRVREILETENGG